MTLKRTGPGIVYPVGKAPPPSRRALLANFDHDGHDLKPEHQTWLDQNVVPVLTSGDHSLWLCGNASSSGADWYNAKLSKKRVQAVVDHLRRRGCPLNRIQAEWKGEQNAGAGDPNDAIDRSVGLALDATAAEHKDAPVPPPDPPKVDKQGLLGRMNHMWLGVGARLGGGGVIWGHETFFFHCFSLDDLTPDNSFNLAVGVHRWGPQLGASAQGALCFIGGVNFPGLELNRRKLPANLGFRHTLPLLAVAKKLYAVPKVAAITNKVLAAGLTGLATLRVSSDRADRFSLRAEMRKAAALAGVTPRMRAATVTTMPLPPNVGRELSAFKGYGSCLTRDETYRQPWEQGE